MNPFFGISCSENYSTVLVTLRATPTSTTTSFLGCGIGLDLCTPCGFVHPLSSFSKLMEKGDVEIWYVLRVSFPERGDVEVIVTSRATPRDSAGIADANGYDATWHTRLGSRRTSRHNTYTSYW